MMQCLKDSLCCAHIFEIWEFVLVRIWESWISILPISCTYDLIVKVFWIWMMQCLKDSLCCAHIFEIWEFVLVWIWESWISIKINKFHSAYLLSNCKASPIVRIGSLRVIQCDINLQTVKTNIQMEQSLPYLFY